MEIAATAIRPVGWKPKGATRDPRATCAVQGRRMANEMLGVGLRSVPSSSKRNGSAPILFTDQDDTAEAGLAEGGPFAGHAHLNRPRRGAVLEERFWIDYIDATSFNGRIAVCLRAAAGDGRDAGEETVLENALEKDGNALKKLVQRPSGMKAGPYNLVIQRIQPDDQRVDHVVVPVSIAGSVQYDDASNNSSTVSPRIIRPAEGAQLEEEFQLQFASSSSSSDTYKVVLIQGSAEGTEVASDLRGGSSVTWTLQRPAHLLAGFYDLIVQRVQDGGTVVDEAQQKVIIDLVFIPR